MDTWEDQYDKWKRTEESKMAVRSVAQSAYDSAVRHYGEDADPWEYGHSFEVALRDDVTDEEVQDMCENMICARTEEIIVNNRMYIVVYDVGD